MGKPNRVKAIACKGSTGVDEANAILLEFSGKRMAILTSTILHESPTIAEIYGTKGKIIIPSRWHEAKRFSILKYGEENSVIFDYPERGFQMEAAAVMEDISKNKKESDIWSLDSSLYLSTLLDQIKAAF